MYREVDAGSGTDDHDVDENENVCDEQYHKHQRGKERRLWNPIAIILVRIVENEAVYYPADHHSVRKGERKDVVVQAIVVCVRDNGDLDQLEGAAGEVEHYEYDQPFAARDATALKVVNSQSKQCDEYGHQDHIEAKLSLDAVYLLLCDLRPH